MALTYPTYVQGIIAMNSTSRATTPEIVALFQDFYKGWVSTPVPSEDLMNLAIMGRGGNIDLNSKRCKMIKQQWSERYNGAEKVEAIAQSLNTRDDVVSRLREVRVPVLLILGEKDISWTLKEAEFAAGELPRGELKAVMAFGRARTGPGTHPDLVHRSSARSRSEPCQNRPGSVPRSPEPM
jgi:pimeloyl-ACP methyl ester carboxylesterase